MTVWRAVIRGQDPRDASHSRSYAGRWHDPRLTPALYTSEDQATAIAEKRHYLPAGEPFVLEVREFTLTLPRLLDLADPTVAEQLPMRFARCLEDSQVALRRGAILGGAAFRVGVDAVRAPSMRGPGACVCFFVRGRGVIDDGPSTFVTVVGDAPA